MRRIPILAWLMLAGGCYTQASNHAVPATFVNDPCGANGSAETCAAKAGCEWNAIQSDCPAGAACPAGVCAMTDPCAALKEKTGCEADERCAWSGVRLASSSIDLCPAGQTCAAGGYCHARDVSGGGCTCVQPIACPANAACPAVECDCSTPTPGTGGGTCTCTCQACAPGETCAPCACDCSAGSFSATGGRGTCTCACPACPADAPCPPCDCACGGGSVSVSGDGSSGTTPTKIGGGPADSLVPDPCAGHADTAACLADRANACTWIELGIVCITAPCPSGACVHMTPVPGGTSGCGCACPSCAADQSCPPCACNCCGQASGFGPTPQPI